MKSVISVLRSIALLLVWSFAIFGAERCGMTNHESALLATVLVIIVVWPSWLLGTRTVPHTKGPFEMMDDEGRAGPTQ